MTSTYSWTIDQFFSFRYLPTCISAIIAPLKKLQTLLLKKFLRENVRICILQNREQKFDEQLQAGKQKGVNWTLTFSGVNSFYIAPVSIVRGGVWPLGANERSVGGPQRPIRASGLMPRPDRPRTASGEREGLNALSDGRRHHL